MTKPSFTEQLIEAIKPDSTRVTIGKTLLIERDAFDKLMRVLEKAIEQRNQLIREAGWFDCIKENEELLSIARGGTK